MAAFDDDSVREAAQRQGRQQRRAARAGARGGEAWQKPEPVDSPRHAQIREGLRRVRAKKRARMDDLKRQPCADCGGTFHPFVMDFDHREGTEKLFNVSAAIPLGLSFERIVAEAAKCDVVCANCHRMRTLRQIERDRAKVSPSPIDPAKCRRGHPRTEANTRLKQRGERTVRECRECEREAARSRRAAREDGAQ